MKVTARNKLGSAVSAHVLLHLLEAVERVSVGGKPTTFRGNATTFELLFLHGTEVDCLWDFGDGTQLSYVPGCRAGQLFTHTYTRFV